jgi:speckle-type POZ protein
MSTGRHVVTLALVTSASAFVTAGVTAALLIAHSSAPDIDTCGLPPGVTLDGLDSQERGLEVRRMLACEDLRFGRMSIEAYRAIVDGLDRVPLPAPELPATIWASSVRGFSTQYTTSSWSANQVLGPPNVYPANGDNQAAWASLGADDRDEWIEVGFDQPQRISATEIYETYNPGAVDSVTLTLQSGRQVEAYRGTAHARGATSFRNRIDLQRCTDEPVVAVRVHLASQQVPGWNEIDAIGVVPCQSRTILAK